MEISTHDLTMPDGRTVRAHDTAPGRDDLLPLVWLHGGLHDGRPPVPLFPAAARLGLRWLGIDRPGYGGSTPDPGWTVASAGRDVVAVADALGFERLTLVGWSGGGPYAIAAASLMPERVAGIVCLAAIAPRDAAGLDWYADLAAPIAEDLRVAERGREEALDHVRRGVPPWPPLADADHDALAGEWAWFPQVVEASAVGPDARTDDYIAMVSPWGVDLGAVRCPVLFLHGEQDTLVPPTHGQWLRSTIGGRLWSSPDDGHISVLRHGDAALEWLARAA